VGPPRGGAPRTVARRCRPPDAGAPPALTPRVTSRPRPRAHLPGAARGTRVALRVAGTGSWASPNVRAGGRRHTRLLDGFWFRDNSTQKASVTPACVPSGAAPPSRHPATCLPAAHLGAYVALAPSAAACTPRKAPGWFGTRTGSVNRGFL
jgi:hypothetical protein